jgi:hypothetical protein
VSGLFSVVFLQILFKYGGTAFELHSRRRASNEPFFSEDVKNLKFIGEVNDSLKIQRFAVQGFLSFHDNARSHSAAAAIEATRRLTFGFSQTPELAPSDYRMLGSLKETLRGQRFAIDDKVKDAVHACL